MTMEQNNPNPSVLKLGPQYNNVSVPMTRRYPDLPKKVLTKDSIIVKKIMEAWDVEGNADKVLNIFLKEQKNLSNYRYWEVLKIVWVLCGSTELAPVFFPMFKSSRSQVHFFMTPEEHKRKRELPDFLKVYRACNEREDHGFSWTLSQEYAEFFKKEYNKKMVISSVISKNEIFALIERNKEEEILIL